MYKNSNKYAISQYNKMNFVINYPDEKVYKGVVPFFYQHGFILSYCCTDIFTLLEKDPKIVASEFLSNFSNNSVYYSYYKLIDMLKKEPIRTVFCLKDTGKDFLITKGAKKIVAMAVNNIRIAHILFVSHKSYGKTIKNDEELFYVLKNLDPTVKTIRCDLINPPDPAIHILENIDNAIVWRSLRDSNP